MKIFYKLTSFGLGTDGKSLPTRTSTAVSDGVSLASSSSILTTLNLNLAHSFNFFVHCAYCLKLQIYNLYICNFVVLVHVQ